MKYFCRSYLLLFLIILTCECENSCKNFLVQHCTDIGIGFNPISTKCIQLIPVQFDLSIDYSVENYIIQKTAKCYNIILYNTSSSNLFSNECQELCPEQYCLLFDNQPNTSIINIFYSSSSTYELIKSRTNDISSYDYYLFDTCSSTDRTNRKLFIGVYVLCAIVVILTIAVILKTIISNRLRNDPDRLYRPYDWYWILACVFCEIQRNNEQRNRPRRNFNEPDLEEDNNQLGENRFNDTTTPTQPIPMSTASSNTTNDGRIYDDSSSGYSFDQHDSGSSSENHMPVSPLANDIIYIDVVTNNLSRRKENHQQSSAFPSIESTSNHYEPLEAKPSSDIIITRH